MDSRRVPRTVSDPKVRQVGFFAPATPLDRSESVHPPRHPLPLPYPTSPHPATPCPVMIPPPRHLSTDLSRHFPLGRLSPLRVARAADSSIPVGSYNPSEFLTPTATTEFSEDPLLLVFLGVFGIYGIVETDGGSNVEVQKEHRAVTGKPQKEKTTKAERRALQEAQRAAKAAAKGWTVSSYISGGNARCIGMLQAFQESIKDYSTPPEKSLIRDLTTKINGYVSFLIECRPLSISMGNAIRFLKTRIAQLPLNLSESEAKVHLISDIDRFINEKIILADKVIVKHAVTKIRDGDVLLTYASSSAVEMLLLHAHELVSRVFLGASSVLSNGTVYSRVGTACVAMVAHQFHVPVLICCEAYKFHERVQLDSICSNELGGPDAISKVSGRKEINTLDGWANSETLQLLNLMYDATPSDYVSMIITDYGMVSWARVIHYINDCYQTISFW
ncbi:UNVERIFIED_CONTAM: Translation initiation factor eIF-2B subunit delta [Sesamum radiatum]|uniref:Translation initiation factor eIF2B subunit delta n=1 Tax=Sesamum radiatum TaxID=300843 RepID=A0AAW2P5F5_SESRA